MSSAPVVTERDHATAERICAHAAGVLRRVRAEAQAAQHPPERVRADGDRESQLAIAALLAELAPDDPVLSEEAKDDRSRVGSRRVWIIDPLDGTREFAEPPRSDWAVHVALAVDGVPVVAAVGLPALDLMYSTAAPPALPPRRDGRPRLLVSRSRPPAFVQALADLIGGDLVPMGSAGAKTMAIVRGDADAYVHAGGQYEWDSAAPVGVALATGLHVSRLDGTPLVYNQPEPWLPDQLVCRPELAATLLKGLQEHV